MSVDYNGSSQYGLVSARPIPLDADFTYLQTIKLDNEIGASIWRLLQAEDNTNKLVIYLNYDFNAGTRRITAAYDRWVLVGYTSHHNTTLGTSIHQIGMQRSGNAIQPILDGVLVGSPTTLVDTADGTTATSDNLTQGCGSTVGSSTRSNFADGDFGELRGWDVALTAAQIANEYRSQKPISREDRLKIWVPAINSVLPAAYADESGNGNAMTPTGTPTVDHHFPF